MFFRAPKTTQEKRYDALFHTQLAEIERDHGPFRSRLRNGRDGYGLPTTYDDIIVKTQRTWKKTRRTQYHQKKTSLEEGEVFAVVLPPEGAELPPGFDADSGEGKFERLAAEIMAVFEQDKVWRFFGNGAVPKRFCASLYGMRGVEDGEAQYRLIDKWSTDDYKQVRGSYEPDARIWAFDEAILELISGQSKPYATDDLQTFPDVPSPKQRAYDDQLYRGALFAQSNWFLQECEIKWDGKSEEPPAYLLICTSGEVAAFKNQENLTSNEPLIEAVRDSLDILLSATYRQ